MADAPRLYLVTPPVFEPSLPDRVAALLDAFDIACLRLTLAASALLAALTVISVPRRRGV